ncbi:unnamed protein product [Thelazia callipaeda]|uniref:PWWP domain-containing protein n=1 Tax=Thelazia callipaeda TaxID=103827 RepID=A0A0N5D774_THECL|nr:unnamed protein product [Thelazia callipaeda]
MSVKMNDDCLEYGSIVWAKMKGYPAWPAMVMYPSEKMEGVPAGRYSVVFLGTRETAIMKRSDLYDYNKYRSEYEVQRKIKGFNEALIEARQAVDGLPLESKNLTTPDNCSSTVVDKSAFISFDTTDPKSSDKKRCRRKSNLSDSSENMLENCLPAPASFMSNEKLSPSLSPVKNNVETNNRWKRNENLSPISETKKSNSLSHSFDIDLGNDPMLPILNDGAFNFLLDGIGLDFDEIAKPLMKSEAKCSKSLGNGYKSEKLHKRHNSSSSSGRSRLLSSMSDGLDDFFGSSSLLSPSDPLSSLSFNDILGVCDDNFTVDSEDRDLSCFDQKNSQMTCLYCGWECQLYGLKWRCSNMECSKWNGIHEPVFSEKEDPESLEVAADVPSNVGLHDSTFDTIHNPLFSNNGSECYTPFLNIFSQTPQSSVKKEDEPDQIQRYSQCTSDKNFDMPSAETFFAVLNQAGSDPNTGNSTFRRTRNGRPKFYKVERTPSVSEDGCRHCFHCNGQVRPQMCGGSRHRWRCVDKKCRKWYGWVRSHEEIPKDLGKKGRWKDLIKIRRKSPSTISSKKTAKKNRKLSGTNQSRSTATRTLRSCVERRARWWCSEKRELRLSPERELRSDPLDLAAVCITLSKSLNSVANTKCDEMGTVDGSLDLLMDMLFSSFAPLLVLTKKIPSILDEEMEKKIWEACVTHTPKFA